MSDEVAADAVHAANTAFYAALESGDLDAMGDVWEHSDRVSVTHPGWPMLRGWAKVAASWDAIFRNTGYIQFVLTDEQVAVAGETAWVTLDENILQSAEGGGDLSGSKANALNVFVHDDERGGWHMVVHHASPVHDDG